jgi:hypothetical protein
MSFLSALAKIGLGIAAPFTGGASLMAMPLTGLLDNVGQAAGKANTAAGQNRQDATQQSMQANQQNMQGQSDYERELNARAQEDATQRKNALRDIYRSSFAQNFKGSPYNPAGVTKMSPEYMVALKNLETQGTSRLAEASPYNMNTVAPLAPYKPIDITDVAGSTGNGQGILSKIADWAGPALSIAGKIPQEKPKTTSMGDNTVYDDEYYNGQGN